MILHILLYTIIGVLRALLLLVIERSIIRSSQKSEPTIEMIANLIIYNLIFDNMKNENTNTVKEGATHKVVDTRLKEPEQLNGVSELEEKTILTNIETIANEVLEAMNNIEKSLNSLSSDQKMEVFGLLQTDPRFIKAMTAFQ